MKYRDLLTNSTHKSTSSPCNLNEEFLHVYFRMNIKFTRMNTSLGK